MTPISDRKLKNSGGTSAYSAEIISAQDYYPFGMIMPGRNFNADKYRFGFNGKEMDDEVKGMGNQQDYGMRILDTRLGKFFTVDPLTKSYPYYSPFAFAGNKPVWAVDRDGLEEFYSNKGELLGIGNPLDKRKFLVLEEKGKTVPYTSSDIKKMSSEQLISIIDSKPWNIVTVPSADELKSIEKINSDPKSDNTEFGYIVAVNKNGEPLPIVVNEGSASEMNQSTQIEELLNSGCKIIRVVHSHQLGGSATHEGGVSKTIVNSSPDPSNINTVDRSVDNQDGKDNDVDNQKKRISNSTVSESAMVIGRKWKWVYSGLQQGTTIGGDPHSGEIFKGTNVVTFYSGKIGDQIQLNLQDLQKIVKKINSQEK